MPGYRVIEVDVGATSPAAGKRLSSIDWPPGSMPVAVLRRRSLRNPDPDLTLATGDRVSLLAPTESADPPAPADSQSV